MSTQRIRFLTREERRAEPRGCGRCILPAKYILTTTELYPGEFAEFIQFKGREAPTEMHDYLCGIHAQPWLKKQRLAGTDNSHSPDSTKEPKA